jgi:Xaa-Pro aminopeptidase
VSAVTSSSRADRVGGRLSDAGVDALLVTGLVNLRYLTGFTGSNGICVIGSGMRRFLTDFRYTERAASEVSGFDREQGPREILEALGEGWPDGAFRLGFEDHSLSVRRHAKIREILPDRVELVPAGGIVEAERAVKEPGELDRIRAAAALADEALVEVLEAGVLGRTERDVQRAVHEAIRSRGAEISFPAIVASGAAGALPHAEARDVEVERNSLVTIDWGAVLDGYASDCTRTYSTGTPSQELLDIYSLVERAQMAGLQAVRPGPTGREVDAVARQVISEAGHGEHFGHGLGHGVGLEVHEDPRLAHTGEDPLAPGNVVTVEPGVYVSGLGGVRIEDLVIVTESGHEVVSGLAKGLTSVS